MGVLQEGITLSAKQLLLIAGVVLIGFGIGNSQDLPASDSDGSESSPRTVAPPATHFKFSDTKEALQMLEQMAAANEAILGKQRETLSQLAFLADKAQAAKSSAAKSAEKK